LETLSYEQIALAPWGVAFSPDGRLFCSGREMWDTGTWCKLPFSAQIPIYIRQVAFSPDGELVALSSDEGPVTIWNVSSGQKVRTLDKAATGSIDVVFSEDGRRLVCLTEYDYTKTRLEIWDAQTWKRLYDLEGAYVHLARGPVNTAVLASRKHGLDLVDLATGKVNEIEPGGEAAGSDAVSQTSTPDDTARIREMLTNQPDFTADVIVEANGEVLKDRATLRISRKGKSWRIVGTDSATHEPRDYLIQGGQQTYELLPNEHKYSRLSGDPRALLVFIPFAMMDEMGKAESLRFEIVGRERVDGHDCLKVAVTSLNSGDASDFLYLAQDLNGLAVRLEANGSGDWDTDADAIQLRDVSLEVADSTFELPKGYVLVDDLD
jgi:hypothetical protein